MDVKFNASIKLDGKKYNAFDVDCETVKVDITERGNGYIYRRMAISNPSDKNSVQITQPKVIDMCLPCNGEVKLHSVAGSHSNWESFLSIDENIGVGQVYEMIPENGRSSDMNVSPFIDVTVDGKAYLFALGWTGQWRFTVTRTEDKVYISGGINNADFYLKPNEKYFIGSVLVMEANETEDAAALRRRFRQVLITDMNPLPKKLGHMPISHCELNCPLWGDTKTVYDQHRKAIQKANATNGFDSYWVDAIWFEDLFPNGVGNYTLHKNLTEGLNPLANELHKAGKNLMVWFEPLRVRTGTQVYNEHPEYLLNVKDNSMDILDYEPDNWVFNIGDDDAYEYVHNTIVRIIKENGIDFFREDFNMAPLAYWLENEEENRHGINEIKFINNFYRLWDELRAEFPNMLIDNCASGGRRIDLETVQRSVVLHRCDGGCGPRVPTKPVEIWNQNQSLTLCEYIPYQSASGWNTTAYSVRSAMTTGVTLVIDYANDDADDEAIKKVLDEVHHFTPYWEGDFYPLEKQSQATDCFIAFQLAKGDNGYATVFRRLDCKESDYKIYFKGIKQDAVYTLRLVDEDRNSTEKIVKGSELINGYTVTLPDPETSLIAEYLIMN